MSKELEAFLKRLAEALGKAKEIEVETVDLRAEEVEIMLRSALLARLARIPVRRIELPKVEFKVPAESHKGKVAEVKLGATKAEGGTRASTVVIGGETALPGCLFEGDMPNKPVVCLDVFDVEIPLPKAVRERLEDVTEDPVTWAKACVERFGAEVVQVHLVSTSPTGLNTPPAEAARTVEEVLQAVKVPIAVGAPGDPRKDPLVLEKVAEVAEGERILLNSAKLDNDYKRIADAAKKHGHVVLGLAALSISLQKALNRALLAEGLTKEDIVMDPTTGALGYGLESTFSTMERIRLAALAGDEELQMPIAAAASNAWGVRESWMTVPEWGPKEPRGILWEISTAIAVLLAGCDFLMMLHPDAATRVKSFIRGLYQRGPSPPVDWISAKF